jgi:general L-amino acid transport system substrate-binding protein
MKSVIYTSIILFALASSINANETRKKIIERGSINCGVSQGVIGFSSIDKDQWSGMDVDFCRAVAAAVFGNLNKVNFFPISQRDRSDVVRGGQVDLLARNFTWTFNREVDSGNHAFIRISYYDGEGFMVRKSSKITSVYQLNNISICAVIGSTSETTARDFFEKQNKQHSIISFRDWEEAVSSYDIGRCDAILIDHSMLYAFKLKLKKPEDHIILKEIINKAPTAIWVKYDDKNWHNIVTWVINILILAEEHGINSNNIDNMLLSKDPEIKKILGLEGDFGKKLGLPNNWAYNVIKQVGNYEEIFERNLGLKSNLKIERGYNKLWTKGGLMYAPPLK